MTNVRKSISDGIEALLKEGLYLMRELKKKDDSQFRSIYQIWYTRALPIVQQLLPERMNEFVNLYQAWIQHFLLDDTSDLHTKRHAYNQFVQQYRILESAQTRLDDTLTNIQGLVQAEVLDNELDAATELWRAGHIRSAGTIAGVVLERHLAKVCSSRNLTSRKKNPTISDWNGILKDNNVYDIPAWRGIQRLTDIRNLCTHPKDRDPTKEEVDELISGVERITKTIF
jgi:hypothetical protein